MNNNHNIANVYAGFGMPHRLEMMITGISQGSCNDAAALRLSSQK